MSNSTNLVNELEELLAHAAETGEYEKTIQTLTKKIDGNPDEALYSFYAGLLLVRIKNYQSGIRYLEIAKNAKLDPGQKLRCLVFLGKAYADVQAYSKAERAFREALQTGVPEPGAYSALGAIFYQRNMINQAIDALQKALEIDPNYPGALNNLGYILIEDKKDYEKGMEYCSKAIQLDPENPAYRDSLAKALIEKKQYTQAKEELEQAIKFGSNNEEILKRYKHLLKLMEGK